MAETYEEAEEFLEECMAVVVKNIKEVKEYLDESGMDVEGMSKEELLEASEIFSLPGRNLFDRGRMTTLQKAILEIL